MKNNKSRGNTFERYVVNKLKEIGFDEAATSRFASKKLDDAKVDIFGMPVNIQTKTLSTKPDIPAILSSMPLDKPNMVWIKSTEKKGNRFYTKPKGLYVCVEEDFFLELLKKYYGE